MRTKNPPLSRAEARILEQFWKLGPSSAREILGLFGGSSRLLVSNLLEAGMLTLRDLKALQDAAARPVRGGQRDD